MSGHSKWATTKHRKGAKDAARAKGFHRASLMATLPGVPFYEREGYHAVERVGHRMPDATTVAFVRMERAL